MLGTSIFIVSKYHPIESFLQRSKDTFMMKKYGRYHLKHVSKLISNNGTKCHFRSPYVIKWKVHKYTYVVFLPKMFNLNLIIRKNSDKSRLWEILQDNWHSLFKNINGKKLGVGVGCSKLKDIKETWQMQSLILDQMLERPLKK